MSWLTLNELHALLPEARRIGHGNPTLHRLNTDSRQLQAGDLFVALRGERFDAHAFLAQAQQAGAAAALAEHGLAEAGLPGLEVDNTLSALATLAQRWRSQLALPLVGVTGSNGKTTVTQMIGAILRAAQGEAALATTGNLNNHIGVPLTLLRLRPSHRLAVVELGMNHPGEIAELAAIAQPTVAVVNNAQREHQEFMHSVEAVARENGAVLSALPADGVAVFPADDEYTPLWQALAGSRRVISFGDSDSATLRTQQARWQGSHWEARVLCALDGGHSWDMRLQLAGRHNLRNALAATAAALACGIAPEVIAQALAAFEPVKGRSQAHTLALEGQTRTLIDDSYNANPDSMRAAVEVLAELPGPRWLVLGDMGEVGERGPLFHAEIGALAHDRHIDTLWCVGVQSRHAADAYGAAARHFGSVAELLAALDSQRPAFASVLVKGSRFMRMEQVVNALRTAAGAAHVA